MDKIKYYFYFLLQLFGSSVWTKMIGIIILAFFIFLTVKPLARFPNNIKRAIKTIRKELKAAKSNPDRFNEKLKWQLKNLKGSTRVFLKELIKKIWFIVPALAILTVGNFLFRIVYAFPLINRQRKRFEKEAKPVFLFKSPKSVVYMGIAGMLLAFLLTNYLVTLLRGGIGFVYLLISNLFNSNVIPNFNWDTLLAKNLFAVSVFAEAPILAIPLFLLLSFIAWKSSWINFEQYRDYNANESGDDRFVELKEVEEQYKKIPDRGKTYKGYGGIPVAHINSQNIQGFSLGSKMKWRNAKFGSILTNAEKVLGLPNKPTGHYFIDDDTVNVLIVGMTRSGKGETYVNPTIDILSRAEIPSSMVIGDPKGELYQASYKTLRKRGYEVDVLSFQNMDFSMSYNPLALAIDSAKKGYYEKTQTRVNAVAESIYRQAKQQGDGNAKYWEDTSISLFNAITIALIDRANETFKNGEKDAWDTITIRNVTKFLTDLGSEDVRVDAEGNIVTNPERGEETYPKSKLTLYFDNLRKINQQSFSKFREMADINFRSSDFASEETKGNVYSSMLSGVNLFLQDNIAKLTSKNSIDLESVGNPRRLSIKFKSNSSSGITNLYAFQTVRINIYGVEGNRLKTKEKLIVEDATALIDGEGYLNYVVQSKLPNKFRITVDFSHPNNDQPQVMNHFFDFHGHKVYKTRGLMKQRDKYTHEPILEGISLKVKKKPEIALFDKDSIDFVYSDKPKAVFLVTPPNRSEYNTIVSFFIDQLFNANYEVALNAGRKTTNRIQFLLDEFANIPAIPKMDEKLSIGLGQNIQFMLIIQNLEQLKAKYGEDVAKTMVGNCSINALIKTTSKDTAKEYSEMLGKRTITKRTKSGNVLDESNPNVRFENIEQPLLTETQLLKLQAGEVVIVRGVKAQDNSGRKVTTDPIFASGKMELPYRYMFLQKEFDQSMTLSDIPIKSEHRSLDLQQIAVEAKSTFDKLVQWRLQITGMIPAGENGAFLSPRTVGDSYSNKTQEELKRSIQDNVINADYDFDETQIEVVSQSQMKEGNRNR